MMIALPLLVSACSLHADHALVAATALAFSGGDPLTVRDTGWSMPREPLPAARKSREAALARALAIAAAGGAPAIGLLPVPEHWAPQFGRTTADLLDPCQNVLVATAVLSDFARGCGEQRALASQRRCVLRRYGTAIGLPGLFAVVQSLLSAPEPTAPEPPVTLPAALPGAGDLFFPLPLRP